jgi:hypothetical protein
MDREKRELIHKYAKFLYRSYSVDELWLMEVISEEEFKLNRDEVRDEGIDYKTFIELVKTVNFIKSDYERYSVLDEDSFMSVYSRFEVESPKTITQYGKIPDVGEEYAGREGC